MKRLMLIAAAGVAVCLSCKSKQAVITERVNAVSVSDTTTLTIDTAHCNTTTIDTTKTAGKFEGNDVVEFVEGGGKVSIDTAGNVTFEGVKKIKRKRKGRIDHSKGITQSKDSASGHAEQLNGVCVEDNTQIKAEEKPKTVRRWHETTFMRIGQLCLIALLMWLLFLYLKRKK